jgi:hypothetical protein
MLRTSARSLIGYSLVEAGGELQELVAPTAFDADLLKRACRAEKNL